MSKPHIHIQNIRSRPRFTIETTLSVEDFLDKLNRHFTIHNKVLGGVVSKKQTVIRLRQDKDKFWAPQLQIRVEPDEDNPEITTVTGLFGPRPSLWTLFLFLYFLGGTIFVFFGMIWGVQLMSPALDISPFFQFGAFLGIFILLATFVATKIGQQIAKPHMNILRTFMETVVREELLESSQLKSSPDALKA